MNVKVRNKIKIRQKNLLNITYNHFDDSKQI